MSDCQPDLFEGFVSRRDDPEAGYTGFQDRASYGYRADIAHEYSSPAWGDCTHLKLAPHRLTREYDNLRRYPENWSADVTTLSFGGGVQSTALLLLIVHRDPRLETVLAGGWPSCAIFADTGDEKEATYEHVGRMVAYCAARGFEVRVVNKIAPTGQVMRMGEQVRTVRRFALPPFFAGDSGSLRRSCTAEYKREVIHKEIRNLLGVPTMRGLRHDLWLGISAEEDQRAKPTDVAWQRRLHPLVSMRWGREECAAYIASLGLESPPRSSCVWCPYHNNREWLALYRARLQGEGAARDWARVVEMDEAIRDMQGRGGIQYPLYLHRSARPIEEVCADLDAQGELFGWEADEDNIDADECGGHCHS